MGTSIILLNFDYIPMAPFSRRLVRSLDMGCVGEFAHVSKAFVPLVPTLASLETINALLTLHLLNTNFPCLDFLLDFQPNSNLSTFCGFF
jgi:hypothetical protein